MKDKYELGWFNQYDEDRWKISLALGISITILTFIFLGRIHIPLMPHRTIIIEPVAFVEEATEKKIKPKKKIEMDKIPDKIPEDAPEVQLDLVLPVNMPETNVPQNLPAANKLQIFEDKNIDMNISKPTFQVSNGEIAPITPDAEIELNQGLNTDWSQENVPTTVITDVQGVQSDNNINAGLSTTIRQEPNSNNVHFAGVQREIQWTEILDPLLCFIESNNQDIGIVAQRTLAGNDKNVNTTKKKISVNGKKFEILLVGKKSKHQVTICMIDLSTDEFVLLIDQGLQRKTSMFKFGKLRRDPSGMIVEFTYRQAKANSELATMRMSQFWSWAKTIKCKN